MKKNIARKLGFWASVSGVVGEGIYIFLTIYILLTVGLASTFPPVVDLIAGIITFITVPILVILFSAIRFANEEDNILGSLGVNFIILFAAMVSINRFVQLTVIQPNLPHVPADLTRFLPYGTGSVMFALENLGWGFFSSLAAVCVAPLFSSSPRNKAIRWLFILYALISFLSVVGYIANIPFPIGPIAWGPILMALFILLSGYFRDMKNQVAQP